MKENLIKKCIDNAVTPHHRLQTDKVPNIPHMCCVTLSTAINSTYNDQINILYDCFISTIISRTTQAIVLHVCSSAQP